MSLPKINLPIYTTKLPSNGQEVKYRPYTVKEEKIILTSAETEDFKEVLEGMKQVVNNCIVSDLDIDKLTQFDTEYMFLKLRSVSSSNILKLSYKNNVCPNNNNGPCEDILKVEVDLNTVEVQQQNENDEEYSTYDLKSYGYGSEGKQIVLTEDGIGVLIRYPTIDDIKTVNPKGNASEMSEALIKSCIIKVFDANTIYERASFTDQELTDFYNGLPIKAKRDLELFMGRLPVLRKTLHYSCAKCTFKQDIVLTGLKDFFV